MRLVHDVLHAFCGTEQGLGGFDYTGVAVSTTTVGWGMAYIGTYLSTPVFMVALVFWVGL